MSSSTKENHSRARLESFVQSHIAPLIITYAQEHALGVIAIADVRVTGKSDLVEIALEQLGKEKITIADFAPLAPKIRSALASSRTFSRRAPEVRIVAYEDTDASTHRLMSLIETLAKN